MTAPKSDTKADQKSAGTKGKMAGDQTANQKGGDKKGNAKPDHLRAGVGIRTPTERENQDTGDRETAGKNDGDRVWTADSRERWGEDQPTLAEQLESQLKTEEKLAKDAK